MQRDKLVYRERMSFPNTFGEIKVNRKQIKKAKNNKLLYFLLKFQINILYFTALHFDWYILRTKLFTSVLSNYKLY